MDLDAPACGLHCRQRWVCRHLSCAIGHVRPAGRLHRQRLAVSQREDVNAAEKILANTCKGVPPLDDLGGVTLLPQMLE